MGQNNLLQDIHVHLLKNADIRTCLRRVTVADFHCCNSCGVRMCTDISSGGRSWGDCPSVSARSPVERPRDRPRPV